MKREQLVRRAGQDRNGNILGEVVFERREVVGLARAFSRRIVEDDRRRRESELSCHNWFNRINFMERTTDFLEDGRALVKVQGGKEVILLIRRGHARPGLRYGLPVRIKLSAEYSNVRLRGSGNGGVVLTCRGHTCGAHPVR